MGYFIIAAALGGIVTIVYSVKIYIISSYVFQNNDNYRAELAIIVSLKLNLKKPVNTKRILISTPVNPVLQGRQRLYYNPDDGHAIIQLPGGVLVAVPMQAIGSETSAHASH